jgi:hypothetical protein
MLLVHEQGLYYSRRKEDVWNGVGVPLSDAAAFAGEGKDDGPPPQDISPLYSVRREKALVHSGRQTRPGTGSLHPVAIEAAAEATKPLKPSV